MQISVKADIAAATRYLALAQKDINRAAVAALNKVAVTSRAVAAREINKVTGLPTNEVRQRVPLARANRYTLTATISAQPWAPNLIRYSKDTRQSARKRAGVRANAWRKSKVYEGTFIGNKGRTVYTRTSAARLPIKSVKGPSVRAEFIKDHTLTAIQGTVGTRFPLEFGRALKATNRWK